MKNKELLINLFNKLKRCGNLTHKEVYDVETGEYVWKRTDQYINIIEQYFAEELENLKK